MVTDTGLMQQMLRFVQVVLGALGAFQRFELISRIGVIIVFKLRAWLMSGNIVPNAYATEPSNYSAELLNASSLSVLRALVFY